MERSSAKRTKTSPRETFPRFLPSSTPTSRGTSPDTVRSRATFKGHDQIGGFFQRTMELSGGAFSIDVHNVLADGDLIVALVTVNAKRLGKSASFPEVHVWRVKDGKVVEFREYQGDEQREDQFWSL